MKRKVRKEVISLLLVFSMITSILTGVPFPVEAKEEGNVPLEGTGDVLYETDFSDWDRFRGNDDIEWSVNGGRMSVTEGYGSKAAARDQEFEDFVFEVDITVDKRKNNGDNTAQAGVLFRVKDIIENSGDGHHGYYFGIDAQSHSVILGKSSGNTWHQIASRPADIEYNKSYHVTIAAAGNHIRCFVGDTASNYAKIDVTDDTHSSGSVGIRTWNAAGTYENVKVSAYEEPVMEGETYTNPLLPMCADPDVLYYNGTYYLYPTNAGDANDDEGIKVYTSTDLVNWTDKGWALKKGDNIWGTRNFWAPDVIERDGIFYMYYTAEERICVATGTSPLGPFVQDKKEPMHLNIPEIDAHVYRDDDGQYYFYFVRFDDGNVIFGAKLNDDMKTIDEDTIVRLLTPDTGWERDMANIVEGPFMLKNEGKYYLTYSGAHFESPNYGAGYAVSDSPLGDFQKYEYNPIMKSNSLAKGAGHHGIVESPDGTELFLVYHRHYDEETTEPRELCIDQIRFRTDERGTDILEVNGPTVTPQHIPSGARDVDNLISFDCPGAESAEALNGTSPDSLELPEVTNLITSKSKPGECKTANIQWNTTGYDPTNPETQEFTATGTFELPEGIANLGNIPLRIEMPVTVYAADIGKTLLKKVYDEHKNKKAKDYMPGDAWAAFAQALSDAKNILDSEDDVSQDAINAATSALQQAAKNLVEKTNEIYPRKLRLEAEDTDMTGTARISNDRGASGGKSVGWIDAYPRDAVTFHLTVPETGAYTIEMGIFSPWANGAHRYYVNGNTEQIALIDYRENIKNNDRHLIEVELEKGGNTFTVVHAGRAESFTNLDYIDLYYAKEPQVENLTLDGKALAGFVSDLRTYEVKRGDLTTLPQLGIQLSQETALSYDVALVQGKTAKAILTHKKNPDIQWTYTVRFLSDNTMNSSIVNFGADPFITWQDGWYYYCRVNRDKAIYVSRARELDRVALGEPHLVYAPSGDEPAAELWAPELHYLNGKWYIYYTAGAGANHRMYVLEGDDPLGTFTFKGKNTPATDKWGIDQTVLEYGGNLYAIWSGWPGDEDVTQRIYIAEMSDPFTITGERVEISRPEYSWEVNGGIPTINEGAQIAVSPDGVVNIIYSASGSWTDNYCLGRLTLRGDDPMDPASWEKGTESIFYMNTSSTYSTGHASFTKSPDGTEDYMVFHANRGAGQGWNGRGVRVQDFSWNDDGTPNFGEAVPYTGKINIPSGTPEITRRRYEAENGTLTPGVYTADTYNSSGGEKVTGMTGDGSGAAIRVTAEKKGSYKLYLAAAANLEGSALSVKIDQAAAVIKEIIPFNANAAAGLSADNWMGYELDVDLTRGAHTIFVGKADGKPAADLDYIELELVTELVDKTELQALYQQHKDKKAGDYASGFSAFETALKAAKAVLDSDGADQAAVDAAAAALKKAVAGLVLPTPVKVDKSRLQALYDQHKGKNAKDYVSGFRAFETALKAAKTLLDAAGADQAAVNAAATALEKAAAGLVLVKPVPKKNTVHKVGKLYYKVTKSASKNGTVTVTKPVKKSYTAITIPDTIKINSYTFKVTAINNSAFSKNTKLQTVKIGNNVSKIGKSAFTNCKKLKKVTIGKGLTSIGSKAFSGDNSLKNIVIKSSKIKKVNSKALQGIHKKAVIDVPNKKVKSYKRIFKNGGQARTVTIK